jgi:DnaJ-class molecular chaperone
MAASAVRDFTAPGADLRYALEVPFLDAARGGEMRITLPDGGGIAVKIPQGARDGQTLRLRGKGGPGHGGGPAGDALITLSVRPHPVFRREGDDILLTLPITIDEAVLGAKVTPDHRRAGEPHHSQGRQFRPRPAPARSRRGAAGGRNRGRPAGGAADRGAARDRRRLRDFLTEWRKTHPTTRARGC